MKPSARPSAIEYASGIPIIVRKAGIDSDESSHSMRDGVAHHHRAHDDQRGRGDGQVVADHADERAEKQRDEEQRPATTAVRPVRPPADTPAALSM